MLCSHSAFWRQNEYDRWWLALMPLYCKTRSQFGKKNQTYISYFIEQKLWHRAKKLVSLKSRWRYSSIKHSWHCDAYCKVCMYAMLLDCEWTKLLRPYHWSIYNGLCVNMTPCFMEPWYKLVIPRWCGKVANSFCHISIDGITYKMQYWYLFENISTKLQW